MRGVGLPSATLPCGSYRSAPKLCRRCVESSLHCVPRRRNLHASEKGIKFSAQAVNLCFGDACQGFKLFHGDQDRFGGLVFGDQHNVTLDCLFEQAAKLILGFASSKRNWFGTEAAGPVGREAWPLTAETHRKIYRLLEYFRLY